MKRFLILASALFLFNHVFACLNGESKMLKDGTYLYQDSEGSVPYGHSFFNVDFDEGIKRLDSLYTASKDLDNLSDKGLLLILQGNYKEAIALYLHIEQMSPNRYATASNIGTAYELAGQNEDALKWIKKAVEIDPGSHHNSEWIHVKILEAKIKGPEFYTTEFLLNTNFGTDVTPHTELPKQSLQNLSAALYYQLNERISFIKPKDAIVARLLFDLGNIAFLLGDYDDALDDYAQAKKYGYMEPLVEQRIVEANKSLREEVANAKWKHQKKLWFFIVILLLIVITAVYIIRRKN